MKHVQKIPLLLGLVLGLCLASCGKDPKDPKKAVTVGGQVGTLTAFTAAETVDFPVTTENIAEGNYPATVANLPTGVSASTPVAIDAEGKGTLTLSGSASAAAGSYTTLTLALDGATSAAFTLTIGAKAIDIATIAGITPPAAGATAATAITETAQFTGAVAWSPALDAGKFAYGQAYTATITLTAKAGYTLTGVAANFFTVAGATTVTSSGTTVTAVFPATGAAPSVSVGTQTGTLTALTAGTASFPVTTTNIAAGTHPASVATLPTGVSAPATVAIDAEGKGTLTLNGSASITAGTTTSLKLTLNGTVSNDFTLTIGAKAIDIAAIAGVTPPVAGATAVTVITETAQFTGTVAWSPALNGGTFAGNTAYTATITLTAKTNYTLTGVAANFFTVADATPVTYTAGGNTVTAVFPKTLSLATLTINKDGAAYASHGKTFTLRKGGTTQYTGTGTGSPVSFSNVAEDTYDIYDGNVDTGITLTVSGAEGSATLNYYTVTFAVSDAGTATGSTISTTYGGSTIASGTVVLGGKDLVVKAEGKNATTYAYAWSGTATGTADEYTATNVSAAVNALCTVTGSTRINIAALAGVTPPVTGATPATAITETAQFTGTVAWSPADAKFQPETVYTATVTLTPKANYTLDGVAANYFTVADATTVTYTAGGNTVAAEFPKTGALVKTVSAGAQSGTLTAETAGQVTFPVTTLNINDGPYTATVSGLPTGVTVSGSVTIAADKGTLTLAGDNTTVAGTYNTLTLTIDGTTSGAFTLTVVEQPTDGHGVKDFENGGTF